MRFDDRLHRWRSKLMIRLVGANQADAVTDLDVAQTPDLCDVASRDRRARFVRPAIERLDRSHLVGVALAVDEPITGSHSAREQPYVGDLLPCRCTFDL